MDRTLAGPLSVVLAVCGLVSITSGQQPSNASRPGASKVVLLGTGTPAANPDRSGPATAIVVNDTAYLVDFGPGVVRRASAAATSRGITALQPTRLAARVRDAPAFRSHGGVPGLDLQPWTLGRRVPLEVYGPGPQGDDGASPRGLSGRHRYPHQRGREPAIVPGRPQGECARNQPPASSTRMRNVTVTAFATKHAMESYGYRFDTPDRSVVISGDTNPTQATIDACRGCDVLIHEVHTSAWLAARPEAGGAPPGTFRRFSEKYHTTTSSWRNWRGRPSRGC